MAGLLISVRDAAEAGSILGLGVGVIDVKNPEAGPLGAADPVVWDQIAQIVGDKAVLSAALGELRDWRGGLPLEDYTYLKWGLSGLRGSLLRERMALAFGEALEAGHRPVAVAYADWRQASSPPPMEVLEVGAGLGAAVLLIDTHSKEGKGLFDWLDEEDIAALRHRTSGLGLGLALAGSLDLRALPKALALQPDWVAARGAVCDAGRTGQIQPDKVKAWLALMGVDPATSAD